MTDSLLDRVVGALDELDEPRDMTADRIFMKPEALAACLAGERAFTNWELAAIAVVTGVNLTWLIDGPRAGGLGRHSDPMSHDAYRTLCAVVGSELARDLTSAALDVHEWEARGITGETLASVQTYLLDRAEVQRATFFDRGARGRP